jgi:hypothetical protein
MWLESDTIALAMFRLYSKKRQEKLMELVGELVKL